MTVISQVKKTLATLKGNKATLAVYALQTKDQETSVVYREVIETTEQIINDLERGLQLLEYKEPQYKGN